MVRYKSTSAEEVVQLSAHIPPSSVMCFVSFCLFVLFFLVGDFCSEIRSSSVTQDTEKQRVPLSLSTLL